MAVQKKKRKVNCGAPLLLRCIYMTGNVTRSSTAAATPSSSCLTGAVRLMLLLLLELRSLAPAAAAASWVRGLSFAGGEHSASDYGTAACQRSLANLASTGATHVRLEVTWFQANSTATLIAPLMTPGSPLRSTDDVALAATVATAAGLGLNVSLAPLVDLDWDDPNTNVPDGAGSITGDLNSWKPKLRAQSRAAIGRSPLGHTQMSEAQWVAWFDSYTTFVTYYAAFAEQHRIAVLDIGTDLQTAAVHPANAPRWQALAQAVKAIFTGKLMLTASAGGRAVPAALWSMVDVIGVDIANVSLSAAPVARLTPAQYRNQSSWTAADERLNMSTAKVSTAWQSGPGRMVLDSLSELHAAHTGKPILLLAGYQSRPNCIVRPEGQPRLDCSEDCSCWTMCIDMDCQADAYAGLLQVVTKAPWFGGLFFHGWSADPTAGGTSDPNYTPWAKPAEAVLRHWFAATAHHVDPPTSASMAAPLPLGLVRTSTLELARELRDTNSAHRVEAARSTPSMTTVARPPPLKTLLNNTRIAVGDVHDMPAFPCVSAAVCLQHCEREAACGFIVFREQWEPVVGDFSCAGAKNNESCCYPGPMRSNYPLAVYPDRATLGFIAAVVRYAPAPPPPPLRAPTLNGYVFGGGEWSYPGFAMGSDEAKLSIDAAAATGANSLEFTPMWYHLLMQLTMETL